MSETAIHIDHLTKDYGNNRGIFDITLDVPKGKVYGYVGTNGSGKTTTIRNLLGFLKPDSGTCDIMGMNSWKESTEIMKYVSYIPGEIAFPNLATGTDFLKLQAEYLGISDFTYMNHIISKLQLDPTASLKRMSKGMKQKTAITAALMGEKDILILDEPTTGLDPLMRDAFLELIREEKSKGRTILMSSHIFEEVEDVCDEVAMIKDGHLIDTVDLWNLRHWKTKTFDISFGSESDYKKFCSTWKYIGKKNPETRSCQTVFAVDEIEKFFFVLQNFHVTNLREEHITLNQYFLQVYGKGEKK